MIQYFILSIRTVKNIIKELTMTMEAEKGPFQTQFSNSKSTTVVQ